MPCPQPEKVQRETCALPLFAEIAVPEVFLNSQDSNKVFVFSPDKAKRSELTLSKTQFLNELTTSLLGVTPTVVVMLMPLQFALLFPWKVIFSLEVPYATSVPEPVG